MATKQLILLIMILLLTACAVPEIHAPGEVLNSIEFRNAAEQRIFWHDPDLPQKAMAQNRLKAKILGFNDFHGHLNKQQIDARPVGGAAVLAAYLEQAASEVDQRAIIVHAGDQVGASPPESALLQDEPSIEFLNLLANEQCQKANLMAPGCNLVGTLGNHEFDEGYAEITRLLYGGRHPNTTSLAADWDGARFPYICANVLSTFTGKTILPAYVIKQIGGVKIAFIGAVLKNTPNMVTPAGVAGLEFLDEARSINAYIPELLAKNIHAIIVTIHQGLYQTSFGDAAVVGQRDLQGKIINIVSALDDEVDIVISGHTHAFTNVLVPNNHGKMILLTQAFAYGTAFDDIDIVLDRVSGDIVEKSAAIETTWADQGPGLVPDAAVAALVARANIAVEPLVNRRIGVAATAITRTQNAAGESALGDLVADALRTTMGADFAFAGPGGIRGNLSSGAITWGNLFTVKPFGNHIIAMTLTGRQITRLLNRQWAGRDSAVILQPSGLSYTWDDRRAVADRIVKTTIATGSPLLANTAYRVAVSSFYAAGGEGFEEFKDGTNRHSGPLVLDALVTHIRALPQPFQANIEGRIRRAY